MRPVCRTGGDRSVRQATVSRRRRFKQGLTGQALLRLRSMHRYAEADDVVSSAFMGTKDRWRRALDAAAVLSSCGMLLVWRVTGPESNS